MSWGVHLKQTDENVREIDALAARLGGRAGLDAVLGDLDRRGHRSWLLGTWLTKRRLGRAVDYAFTWNGRDRRDKQWWPQGISTSADASDTEDIDGRRVLAVSWYAKDHDGEGGHGARITFVDLTTLRYRHVLLVSPVLDQDGALVLRPLRIHAGGIVWNGPYLHVAATARGFMTCRIDDIMRVPDTPSTRSRLGLVGEEVAAYGYRYVLPVRFTYQAYAEDGVDKLRYSFLSLDRTQTPPALMSGEYGRGKQTTRLARFDLQPDSLLLSTNQDGLALPIAIDANGVRGMQGVCVVKGDYYVTVSHGPWAAGSVFSGRPGALKQHRGATPMGPEDIAYWPSEDRFWSVSEHPRRRWVFAMKRSAFH